jgi:hypothetical protein
MSEQSLQQTVQNALHGGEEHSEEMMPTFLISFFPKPMFLLIIECATKA